MDSESEDEEYIAVIAAEKQLNTVASAGNPKQVCRPTCQRKRREVAGR